MEPALGLTGEAAGDARRRLAEIASGAGFSGERQPGRLDGPPVGRPGRRRPGPGRRPGPRQARLSSLRTRQEGPLRHPSVNRGPSLRLKGRGRRRSRCAARRRRGRRGCGPRRRRRRATGSTTSRYALSFGSVPDGRTTTRAASVRRITTSASGSRSSTSVTGSSEQRGRRWRPGSGPSRRRSRAGRRPAPRAGRWRSTPNSAASSSSRSVSVRPSRLEPGGQLGDQQRGGDAVLVADVVRGDAVAERLLVAEDQRGPPPARTIHLNPVSVSPYGRPRAAHIARSRDDDTIVVAYRPGHAAAHQVVGEQHADLVAAQHPPAAAAGRAPPPRTGRRPGRWRSRGPRRSRAASASSQVHRARLLRVGERDGREVRVRLGLLGHHRRRRRSRPAANAAASTAAAHPVQRRVRHRQVPRAVRVEHRGGAAPRTTSTRSSPSTCAGPAERHVATAGRPRGSPPRSRRRPAARSARPAPARRPAARRGRPCSRCPAAGCGWRSPSRRPPRRAAAPRTRAPAWAAAGAAAAPAGRRRWPPGRSRSANRASRAGRRTRSPAGRRRPGRRASATSPAAARRDHGEVHAVRAGAQRAAQPGGAEASAARRTGRRARRRSPGSRSSTAAQLVPAGRVGVVGEPAPGLLAQVVDVSGVRRHAS